MGISGLLPFLKDASTSVNIKQFEGQTVAIDTYCWIYRGAFSCAEELALGKRADGHVKYVLKYVHRLLEWGIKPIMVFDGSCLPSKKGTEAKRKESKEAYRKKAAQCLVEGKRTEARECFQRSIDCTPQMALDVIKAVHALGVDVCVAPYEADAQLAFLSTRNIAQVVITEDSDLILFGCPKVLYKLDINGNGTLVEKEKIISITQFDSADNFQRFRWMCILSGCDYLESLPGIGLGKAKKLLKSIKKSDIDHVLKQMPKVLKMPNLNISCEYVERFKKADKTFKYQIVFDPRERKLTSLHPYEGDDESEDLTFAGYFYDGELALQHSLGNIEVHTRKIHYDFNPDKCNYKPPPKFINNPPPHMKSIWSKNYQTYDASSTSTNKGRNFFNITSQRKETIVINNRPSTLGLKKSLDLPKYQVITKTSPKEEKCYDMNKIKKRKFTNLDSMLDTDSVGSEGSASSFQSDESDMKNSNDSSSKRSKTNHACISDIDNLLTDYNIKSENSQDDKLLSPIKELLIGNQQEEEEESEEQIKKEFLEKTHSPIMTKKSCLDHFKRNENKFVRDRNAEDSPILNEKSLTDFNKDSKSCSPVSITKTRNLNLKSRDILDDIENIEIVISDDSSKPRNSVNIVNNHLGKSKASKKPLQNKQKPITSFLTSYEYKKGTKFSRF